MNTQDTKPAGIGPGGRYWNVLNGGNEFTVANWILDSPPAHMAWRMHALSLVHLRGECDGQPPALFFEGATHEVQCQAIDPDCKVILLDWETPPQVPVLTPPDFIVQIAASSDAEALKQVEALLPRFLVGELLPDSDFRRRWTEALGGVHAPSRRVMLT